MAGLTGGDVFFFEGFKPGMQASLEIFLLAAPSVSQRTDKDYISATADLWDVRRVLRTVVVYPSNSSSISVTDLVLVSFPLLLLRVTELERVSLNKRATFWWGAGHSRSGDQESDLGVSGGGAALSGCFRLF